MMRHPARGKILIRIALDWGVKRRWFGLESDQSLRLRVRDAILRTLTTHEKTSVNKARTEAP
jgi:hypothetical protein